MSQAESAGAAHKKGWCSGSMPTGIPFSHHASIDNPPIPTAKRLAFGDKEFELVANIDT
jgi:hypothetical protein